MRTIGHLFEEFKGLFILAWRALRGGRACWHCSKFSAQPEIQWERPFCSRACAGAWRKLFNDAQEMALDRRAREAGMGA